MEVLLRGLRDFFSAMSAPDWVNSLLAMAAIGLSGLSLYFQRRDRRPQVEIATSLGEAHHPSSHDPSTGTFKAPMLSVVRLSVRNLGSRPIDVRSAGSSWLLGEERTIALYGFFPDGCVKPDGAKDGYVFVTDIVTNQQSLAQRLLPFYHVWIVDQMNRRWQLGILHLPP